MYWSFSAPNVTNKFSVISMNSLNPGWVYCLSNKAMPGIYEIGKTTITSDERAVPAS